MTQVNHSERDMVSAQEVGVFPNLCHGGLSLLEVAVPFVKLPAL